MKLSDIRGERTLDVIADLIEPIANIAADKEAAKLFAKQKAPEGTEPRAFLMERLKSAVPSLLRTHKTDLITILSTIEGVSAKEYAESLNLVKIMQDAVDLVTDQAFLAIFTSAQTDSSSGAAQGNIVVQKA